MIVRDVGNSVGTRLHVPKGKAPLGFDFDAALLDRSSDRVDQSNDNLRGKFESRKVLRIEQHSLST